MRTQNTNLIKNTKELGLIDQFAGYVLDSYIYKVAKKLEMSDEERFGAMLFASHIFHKIYHKVKELEAEQCSL